MSLPMVFLHGWGQSRQVWQKQQAFFPDATFLNLPGHGGAVDASDWVTSISGQLPESPCMLIGWSLGGILAMNVALQHPEKVASLVLVSTTPSFCSKQGWVHGCSDELFQAFRSGIESNSAKTMGRFFALMFQGDEMSRQAYNDIARIAVDKENPPSGEALRRGLEQLENLDLRHQLSRIVQPVMVMHGQEDAIIPCSAGAQLAQSLTAGSWHSFAHCGHAPFLSHSHMFNETLEAWCHKR